MTRAVTPKTVDNREGFEVNRTEGKKGFPKGECGMDDEVESYYGNPRFLVKPLEVMFSPYLNRSRLCKG